MRLGLNAEQLTELEIDLDQNVIHLFVTIVVCAVLVNALEEVVVTGRRGNTGVVRITLSVLSTSDLITVTNVLSNNVTMSGAKAFSDVALVLKDPIIYIPPLGILGHVRGKVKPSDYLSGHSVALPVRFLVLTAAAGLRDGLGDGALALREVRHGASKIRALISRCGLCERELGHGVETRPHGRHLQHLALCLVTIPFPSVDASLAEGTILSRTVCVVQLCNVHYVRTVRLTVCGLWVVVQLKLMPLDHPVVVPFEAAPTMALCRWRGGPANTLELGLRDGLAVGRRGHLGRFEHTRTTSRSCVWRLSSWNGTVVRFLGRNIPLRPTPPIVRIRQPGMLGRQIGEGHNIELHAIHDELSNAHWLASLRSGVPALAVGVQTAELLDDVATALLVALLDGLMAAPADADLRVNGTAGEIVNRAHLMSAHGAAPGRSST